MMKWLAPAAAALLLAAPSPASAGELRLSIANGRVTLVAQDVSLQQILVEWGRVGQTKVVGAERLTGPMVTLELNDVPEKRALETLLRTASGYIAKPRPAGLGASTYDQILIMPASRPPAVSASAMPPRPQPVVNMPNVMIDDDGEPTGTPPVMPPGSVPPNMVPPGQYPGPAQPAAPQQYPGFQPQPGQSPTLNRPGMLPQQQPGMPGNPYQPNPMQPAPPVRPGGPGGGDGESR